MAAMALASSAGRLTAADLDALPDDGLRHELIDGAFFMTPSPGVDHQRMAFRLAVQLAQAAPPELEVLMAPLDVVLGEDVVEPDIVMADRSQYSRRGLVGPPVLAVEVRSPSTAHIDAGRKREIYQAAGVEHYWLADPEAASLTLLRLLSGRYHEEAVVTGTATIEISEPVRVRLHPAALVSS